MKQAVFWDLAPLDLVGTDVKEERPLLQDPNGTTPRNTALFMYSYVGT
jgi:hypothetical protein